MHLDEKPQRRRRGEELEDALLQAAWDELADVGYGALTFESVAQRAGTSRTVVYRRWPTRRELAEAAVGYASRRHPTELPDTGTVRGDLLALMREANEKRVVLMALFIIYMGGYFQETGRTPYDLRSLVIEGGGNSLDVVLERAVERGEIERDRLTPRVTTLVPDLFRHEAMMRLGPVPDDVLVSIVDEVFLPLVTGAAPGSIPSDA